MKSCNVNKQIIKLVDMWPEELKKLIVINIYFWKSFESTSR